MNEPPNTSEAALVGRSFANRFHGPVLAWGILGLSLILTLTAYKVSSHLVDQRLQDTFEFRTHEINQAIQDRLAIYEQILWSGVALFYASTDQEVQRHQWAAFVESLSIDEHWPGIQGIGFSIPILPEEKAAHESHIQSEGFLDYQIIPTGERDRYSAIIYLEPFNWRNKRAFGYDMWSNAMRREAMSRARDEGVAATSGIITLVQETNEDIQRGFLTYVPVYKGGVIPQTVEERRETFLGWVYAPFRAANLMKGILGSEDSDIVFSIFDSNVRTKENLLYQNIPTSELEETPKFAKTEHITLQGRPWTIEFKTAPNALNQESYLPSIVVLTGVVIDILLFYIILSLQHVNRRAKNIAVHMTQDLQAAKEGLQSEVSARTMELSEAQRTLESHVQERTKELEAKVQELEKMNQLTSGRELRVIELKQEVNDLAKELNRPAPYKNAE